MHILLSLGIEGHGGGKIQNKARRWPGPRRKGARGFEIAGPIHEASNEAECKHTCRDVDVVDGWMQ